MKIKIRGMRGEKVKKAAERKGGSLVAPKDTNPDLLLLEDDLLLSGEREKAQSLLISPSQNQEPETFPAPEKKEKSPELPEPLVRMKDSLVKEASSTSDSLKAPRPEPKEPSAENNSKKEKEKTRPRSRSRSKSWSHTTSQSPPYTRPRRRHRS